VKNLQLIFFKTSCKLFLFFTQSSKSKWSTCSDCKLKSKW